MIRLVLMGPPGVGKGTQASRLREIFGVPHVSTGDLLRASTRDGTELGARVKGFVDSGALVPDGVVGEVLERRLAADDAARGFILDGFPRTAAQVEILDRVLERHGSTLDRVFVLSVPEEEIVRRLSGRRVCPSCGELYHVESRPTRVDGVCDVCGAKLIRRADDEEGVVRRRLQVYADETLPVAEAYRRRGILTEVDGSGDSSAVLERLKSRVEWS